MHGICAIIPEAKQFHIFHAWGAIFDYHRKHYIDIMTTILMTKAHPRLCQTHKFNRDFFMLFYYWLQFL